MLDPLLNHGIVYALAGALAGLMSGILGIGGGVIIVPALAYIFSHTPQIPIQLNMHMAAGTSLAVMVFTSQSSIYAHVLKGSVLWSVYFKMMPGIAIGTMLGATAAHYIPTHWLAIIFGVFLLLIAVKMLLELHVDRTHHIPPAWVNRSVSALIGFKSGLLGVGGGVLVIPYLTYCGIETKKIAAVSALCTLTVALVGTTTFVLSGLSQTDMPAYASGYVYWPAVAAIIVPSIMFAQVGTSIAYRLPVQQLRYAFVVILFITAIDMLF